MGQCCGKTPTASSKGAEMNLPRPPETPIDPGQKLLFHVILSKFKVRGIDTVSFTQLSTYLRISFSHKNFTTETATEKSGNKFNQTFEFNHETSKRRMQDEKLVIGLCQGNKVIATAMISLISIAKGPIHQSFPLLSRGGEEKGRLVFNAEMNQITELTLVPHMVRFVLDEPTDGLYNMNLKVHADRTIESNMSNIIERLNFIFDEEDEFESSNIPILKFNTSIESIRTSAIQLRLFRHSHADETSHSNIHAECWIGISKLFKEDKKNIYHMESSLFVSKEELSTHMADFPDSTSTDHSKFFNEVLWHSGKKVGTVTGKLSLRGLPVIYQMICGVNTENGYVIQDSLLNPKQSYKYSKKELPPEMVKIINSTEELKMFIRKGRHSVKSDYKDYKAHVNLLNEIIENLEKTDRESMICFIYKDVGDLLKAQRSLLDLGELLINYADFIQYDVKPFYFDCLVRLNQRGELGLGYISFVNEGPSMYQKRKEIAERYFEFLQEMLRFALSRMNFKGIEAKTQKFVENFLAISYFRFPAFRMKLLEALKSKSFYPVEEWRGITMDLEDDIHDSDLVPALDWPKLFYELISTDAYKAHCKGLDDERWQQKIAKRGLVFFCFIDEWARHINQEFVRANLPWNHIPGYNVVVKTFLIELKERHITQYPEALIEASISLLRNNLLLNVYVSILFHKTNIHEFQSTFDCFNIMNSWFECVYKRHSKLPKNFDVPFFVSGIKIALTSQVCLSVAKTLWFIYMNFHMLTGNLRKAIIRDILLNEMFEPLFFHWSRDVRKMFYCLLMYRILSLHTVNFESEKLSKSDLKLIEKTEKLIKADERKVKSATSPLMKAAIKDFVQVREGYNKWLESVNAGLDSSTSNLFKQYKVFPYPTYNIVNHYQDFSEKKIEEW